MQVKKKAKTCDVKKLKTITLPVQYYAVTYY